MLVLQNLYTLVKLVKIWLFEMWFPPRHFHFQILGLFHFVFICCCWNSCMNLVTLNNKYSLWWTVACTCMRFCYCLSPLPLTSKESSLWFRLNLPNIDDSTIKCDLLDLLSESVFTPCLLTFAFFRQAVAIRIFVHYVFGSIFSIFWPATASSWSSMILQVFPILLNCFYMEKSKILCSYQIF